MLPLKFLYFKCEVCNKTYKGRPDLQDGTCFLNSTVSAQVTATLNTELDPYTTRLNMLFKIPPNTNENIKLIVNCRKTVTIKVTYVSEPASTYDEFYFPSDIQTELVSEFKCTGSIIEFIFKDQDLNYSNSSLVSSFLVFVYDFETPIRFQITVSALQELDNILVFIILGGTFVMVSLFFLSWRCYRIYEDRRSAEELKKQRDNRLQRPMNTMLIEIKGSEELRKLMMNQINKKVNKNYQ